VIRLVASENDPRSNAKTLDWLDHALFHLARSPNEEELRLRKLPDNGLKGLKENLCLPISLKPCHHADEDLVGRHPKMGSHVLERAMRVESLQVEGRWRFTDPFR